MIDTDISAVNISPATPDKIVGADIYNKYIVSVIFKVIVLM